MPYTYHTKKTGDKKFCMTSKTSGKTYCYSSKEAMEKSKRLHEAFKHGFVMTQKDK